MASRIRHSGTVVALLSVAPDPMISLGPPARGIPIQIAQHPGDGMDNLPVWI
jgi:hypothetical protein